MEERREMNGQRMMTREELEMRLPALNHIAEQRDAKFRLRYAEKTLNNGIERGYTLDAGTRVSLTLPVVETRGFSVLRGLPSRTDIVL